MTRWKAAILPGGLPAWLLVQVILSSYTAVGIFEEWGLSMRLFDATVSSPTRQWDEHVQQNPGHQSEERQELLQWALLSPELRKILAADLLLYDFAVMTFRSQTRHLLGE